MLVQGWGHALSRCMPFFAVVVSVEPTGHEVVRVMLERERDDADMLLTMALSDARDLRAKLDAAIRAAEAKAPADPFYYARTRGKDDLMKIRTITITAEVPADFPEMDDQGISLLLLESFLAWMAEVRRTYGEPLPNEIIQARHRWVELLRHSRVHVEEESRKITREELDSHRESHTKENSWWLKDARGIECCRVCDDCEDAAMSTYQPGIFDASTYASVVDEPIEPED